MNTKKLLLILSICIFILLLSAGMAFASTTHTVNSGDTLWGLSKAYGVSVSSIMKANGLTSTIIYPGQKLIIPTTSNQTTYTVKPGDTLWGIANKFGTTVNAIRQANNKWDNYLYVGQKLVIPVSNLISKTPSNGVTASEMELMARVVQAEAGGEPYTGQVAVAAVILNRVESPQFPNSINGVIYEPYAFEVVSNGMIWSRYPGDTAFQATKDAVNGYDPTYGALYFWNPATVSGSNWVWTRQQTTQIGNHVFAK